MAVRPVLRLPAPQLKMVAEPVARLDQPAQEVADDHCVGLAAPQIGVGLRVFAMDVSGHPKARSCHGLVVLFNPEVLLGSEPKVAREGCMSVPDLTGNVLRPSRVVVRGMTSQGSIRVIEADALEARRCCTSWTTWTGGCSWTGSPLPTPTCSNEEPTADLNHRCLPYAYPTTSFVAVLVLP